MRYQISALALAVVISGCSQQTAEKTETEPAAEAVEFNLTGAPTVEFAVSGMTCEAGCASKVHEILAGQPGVVDATVDFPAERATVAIEKDAFDPEAALAALADYQFEGKLLDGSTAPATSEPVEETDVPAVATPGSES
ncbi:MAG: heavy metal-associated domain-containing protein [Planctomycetota bacterium]